MPQISFNVPKTQVPFMMEHLQKFEFVNQLLVEKEFQLSAKQIELIEIERTNAKNDPNYMLDWDELKINLVN